MSNMIKLLTVGFLLQPEVYNAKSQRQWYLPRNFHLPTMIFHKIEDWNGKDYYQGISNEFVHAHTRTHGGL